MINLKQYFLNNSIKANRSTFVPKSYAVALAKLHSNEKTNNIFKVFSELFKSSQPYREQFDVFLESTFHIDSKRIVSLKDNKYEDTYLSEDYPFSSSLTNGLQIVKEILGETDLANIPLANVMRIGLGEVEEVCLKKPIINCGINQGFFDYVIAREHLLNQHTMNTHEIAEFFFKVLEYKSLFAELLNGVKSANKQRCLEMICTLCLTKYGPALLLHDFDQLRELDFERLLYHAGIDIGLLINILNYYSEEPESVIPQMFNNYLLDLDSQVVDVLTRREKETLEFIGQSYGLTRERVRQIEQVKGIDPFNEFYLDNFTNGNGNLIFVFPKLSSVFSLNAFKKEFGSLNDCFRNLMTSIKYAGAAKYYKEFDAIVENENVYNIFKRNADVVFGDYFKKEELDAKVSELLESVQDYGFTKEIIINYVNFHYKKGTDYVYSRVSLIKAFRANIILLKYFDNGVRYSNLAQIEEMNRYSIDEFGEVLFNEDDIKSHNCHNIREVFERADVKLNGRGTYIHASKAAELPVELLEKILTYINARGIAVAYSDIFETFKNALIEIGITNKYALQGAMSEYIGQLFKGKRDYVAPIETKQTLRDSMQRWMETRPSIFTYEDFKKEFKGVASSVFMSTIYEVDSVVYYWGQGYIDVNKLNISQNERDQLKKLIDYLIDQYHMEYCSADELFELASIQMKNFISKCKMRYSYDLFSVVQSIFKEEYKFKRPLLGSKEAIFENAYEVIDGYLASKNIVKLSKMRKYFEAKTGVQHDGKYYVSNYKIIKAKWNEFVCVDADTIIRKETIGVTEKELIRLDVILDMLLEQKPVISIKEDLLKKHFFTQIADMKINPFILMGLVNTYLHEKYEVIMDLAMYKYGSFSVKRR